MNPWLERTVAPVIAESTGMTIVLDPDFVIDLGELPGDVIEVGDWWSFRKVYEQAGRRPPAGVGSFALVLRGSLAAEHLPWDIEKASKAVVSARLPGPPEVRLVLADLAGDEADRAIHAVEHAADRVAGLLGCLTGVMVEAGPLSRTEQLRLAASLAVRIRREPRLLALARRWVG